MQLVYVQISQNTFVELQPANGRPLGVSHFGLHVENTKDAVAMFKARGAKTEDINVSGTKAILSNISDPNGNRMELSELPPEVAAPPGDEPLEVGVRKDRRGLSHFCRRNPMEPST